MSLREKLRKQREASGTSLDVFDIASNPFPSASQTLGHYHCPVPEDDDAERRILTFLCDRRTDVLVVSGPQGVGKTNFLNYLESQIQDARTEIGGYYVVRYLADPEPSFDGLIHTIFQEFGTEHLRIVSRSLSDSGDPGSVLSQTVQSYDLQNALQSLHDNSSDDEIFELCLEWLFGFRLLKSHRENLGVTFRLDTVESRTAVLRDYVRLSARLGRLNGIFLMLDELEKQAGVLGPRAVIRYLSALRAITDALPTHLFVVIAITPDALLRYSSALPALRSRFADPLELRPLMHATEARELADFYLERARIVGENKATDRLISGHEIEVVFGKGKALAELRGDAGVRQRDFLNRLHDIAEGKIQRVS